MSDELSPKIEKAIDVVYNAAEDFYDFSASQFETPAEVKKLFTQFKRLTAAMEKLAAAMEATEA